MTDITIKRLNASQSDFDSALAKLLAWDDSVDHQVNESVRHILHEVKTRGDQAVLEFTEKFDRLKVGSVSELEMGQGRLQKALEAIPQDQRVALESAAARIRDYHQRQNQKSWQYEDEDGTVLGQEGDPAGSRRAVRAGWQGGVSVVCADERHSRESGRGERSHYGGAHA